MERILRSLTRISCWILRRRRLDGRNRTLRVSKTDSSYVHLMHKILIDSFLPIWHFIGVNRRGWNVSDYHPNSFLKNRRYAEKLSKDNPAQSVKEENV